MSYKTLLVHATRDRESLARLRCAGALADEFEATIVGVGAEAIPPALMSGTEAQPYYAGEWIGAFRDQIETDLAIAEKTFNETIGARPKSWRESWMGPNQALAANAAAADLIVAGGVGKAHIDAYRHIDAGALALTAGRPLLVCPPGADHLPKEPVLVAWKNTREARRAVIDALPLLRRAPSVTVLEVAPDVDGEGRTSGQDVIDLLHRHGVVAHLECAAKTGSSGQTILRRADRGPHLIVAGAYGHSRADEWAFGGVTRTLLRQEQHFLLLSH